jgi:hypothetical protein
MNVRRWWLIGAMTLGPLGGCSGERDATRDAAVIPVAPSANDTSSSHAVTAAAAPRVKQFQGISVTIPGGWIEQPPASEFIQAEYQLNGPGGPARLTLSSAGGGLDANLERWKGQFLTGPDDPPPQQDTIGIAGRDAVLLEVTGQFQDQFSGGGPQPNWSLLGAVIPTGPANFFLKLTGPRETVAEHRDAFRRMVETARLDP